MTFKTLTPILWCDDLKETIRFYTSVLDFKIAEQSDEWEWASLRKDEIEIMLSKPNEHMPHDKLIFTGSFYFKTDKVDELWETLKDRTKICYSIENFDWQMREFAIYDNNGYILQFGEDISSFAAQA